MKGKLILTLASVIFFCQAQADAKGLSKDAVRRISERYRRMNTLVLEKAMTISYDSKLLAFDLYSLQFPLSETVDIKDDALVDVERVTGSLIEPKIQFEVGTFLIITSWRFDKDNRIELWCTTAKDYPIERRTTFKTTMRNETINIKFRFFFDKSVLKANDLETVFQAIDLWVKPFPTKEEAMAYRNTLVTVPEIKSGMTVAEVESVFGVPIRKAILGDKMIYKYEDMTVEFVDGKVSDVQF